MKIIIFAGGTGKRFWPVSRKNSPKQFHKVIGDKPLVRLKYDYLRLGYKPDDIFLTTGKQFENEVRGIFPELASDHFIYEPEMRDTGPSVALSVAYVANKYPGEIVSIQWSDHYIKKPEVFISALQEAEKIASQTGKAVNITEKPRFPTPHRGYLKYGKHLRALGKDHTLCEFIRFTEKPTLEVAKKYLESGDYAWNLGYWVLTPQIIETKYQLFAPEIYTAIQKIKEHDFTGPSLNEYTTLEKKSFDYIFSENIEPSEVFVINTNMGWHDVGEWISLKETLENEPSDNVNYGNTIDLKSHDSLIYNYEPEKLVATIGLEGLIVVNTKDVIAVFPKDANPEIKALLNQLETKELEKYL